MHWLDSYQQRFVLILHCQRIRQLGTIMHALLGNVNSQTLQQFASTCPETNEASAITEI